MAVEPGRETIAIVGAGVSGLTCARALADAGRPVLVIERARGVGGRCATRRMEGHAIDFGVAFFHGRDPDFLAALDRVPATAVPDWPSAILGGGSPCQPEAFTPGERRLAFVEGVGAFPRSLTRDLDLRMGIRVLRLTLADGLVGLHTDDGKTVQVRTAVLALAAEQAHALLGTVPTPVMGLRAASAILSMTRSHSCLSLTAVYGRDVAPALSWHASYPDHSDVLQMASHDSSKRPGAPAVVLVYQAHPRWSRQHLGKPEWPALLLAEAARLFGAWASKPRLTHEHQWTYARQDLSSELSGPMLIGLPGGARLGLCGDRFAPGAGVEAAWRSGRALADRLTA